jgi:hypothetical protein
MIEMEVIIAADVSEESTTPNRKKGHHLSEEHITKQKLVRLLDALGLDQQNVDAFPVEGYSPEQVV